MTGSANPTIAPLNTHANEVEVGTSVARILVGGGHPAMHQWCTHLKLSLAPGGPRVK